MSVSERLCGIMTASNDVIETCFGPEARVVESGANSKYLFVYNFDESKRWHLHDFVMEWESLRRQILELQVKTYGGTWHILLGTLFVYKISSSTEQTESKSIYLDVISGGSRETSAYGTPGRTMIYSDNRSGKLMEGSSGGYYGKRSEIVKQIIDGGALVVEKEQLPPKIDVEKTADFFVKAFWDGSWNPPNFVIRK